MKKLILTSVIAWGTLSTHAISAQEITPAPATPPTPAAPEPPPAPGPSAPATAPEQPPAPAAPKPIVPSSPVQAAPPPQGKIRLAAEAPPPSDSRRTYHRHDGFYLRANFGLGASWANFNDEGRRDEDVSATGTGIALDLLIGGSPSPGVAIGGGLLGNWLFSADFEADDGSSTEDRNVSSALIGVFIDGFPRVTGGFHLGGLVGFSALAVSKDGNPTDTAGLGGAAWLGYDHWVADDWALGGLVRFTAAQTVGEDAPFDVTASQANLTLMFSALYH